MNGLSIITWVFTGLLLVLVVVCVAAGRGAIPRNRLIGVRIPALQRSAAAWRVGHAAGVLPATVALAAALVFSLVGLAVPIADVGSLIAFVAGLVWVLARASKAANAS